MAPSYNSTTTYIYESANGESNISIYGSSQTFKSTYFALNHRGYIYAEVSGAYTFNSSYVDDILFFWYNSSAYSGWDESNAGVVQWCGREENATYSVNLLSGQYYPIRLVYANAETNSYESITITAPDGTVLLGPDTTGTPNIVGYSCDGTSAPMYPPFGQET